MINIHQVSRLLQVVAPWINVWGGSHPNLAVALNGSSSVSAEWRPLQPKDVVVVCAFLLRKSGSSS